MQQRRLKNVRQKQERYPNIAVFGHGHRAWQRGRPRKRWMNNIDEDVAEMGLETQDIIQACTLAAGDSNTLKDM